MVLHFRHETERILTSSCSEYTKTDLFDGFFLVRSRRLELPLRLKNSDLNAARLPIPPRPHTVFLVFILCYYFWKDKSFNLTTIKNPVSFLK